MTASAKSWKVRKRKQKQTPYKVSDSTMTSSISLKSLLPHIDTKQGLTVYLAEKNKIASGDVYKKDVIIYETVIKTWQNFLSKCRPMVTKKQTR